MQESALAKGDCHQLHTEVSDTRPLTARGAGKTHSPESPLSSSREQAQQCLQPKQKEDKQLFG